MDEKDEIEIGRSLLRDYFRTLTGIYALTLYDKKTEHYKRLETLSRTGLKNISENKEGRKMAEAHFECAVSDEELSKLEKTISLLEEGKISGKEIIDIQERAIKIGNAANLKRYLS
ncbi:hypothetical protein HYT25_03345 [Candidatus Pacearchaeota archaeon]|nr:hypothetical protein [Candidatus Pacearchaeota archaeon]